MSNYMRRAREAKLRRKKEEQLEARTAKRREEKRQQEMDKQQAEEQEKRRQRTVIQQEAKRLREKAQREKARRRKEQEQQSQRQKEQEAKRLREEFLKQKQRQQEVERKRDRLQKMEQQEKKQQQQERRRKEQPKVRPSPLQRSVEEKDGESGDEGKDEETNLSNYTDTELREQKRKLSDQMGKGADEYIINQKDKIEMEQIRREQKQVRKSFATHNIFARQEKKNLQVQLKQLQQRQKAIINETLKKDNEKRNVEDQINNATDMDRTLGKGDELYSKLQDIENELKQLENKETDLTAKEDELLHKMDIANKIIQKTTEETEYAKFNNTQLREIKKRFKDTIKRNEEKKKTKLTKEERDVVRNSDDRAEKQLIKIAQEMSRRMTKGSMKAQASMDDLHPFVMKPAAPQLHMQKLHMQTSMEKVELADPAMETLADDVHVQAVQPMKCGDKMACHKHEPSESKMKRKSHDKGTHEPAGDILTDLKKLGSMFGGKKEKKPKGKKLIADPQQCDSCGELHDGIHDCEVQALVKMLDGYDSEGTALEKPRCPTMGIASRKMHEMNINDVL